jgi:hypothetical protein
VQGEKSMPVIFGVLIVAVIGASWMLSNIQKSQK